MKERPGSQDPRSLMAQQVEKKTEGALLKNIVLYSSGNIYKRLLGLLNALVRPNLLTPETYGIWSLLTLINAYADHSHLGARHAMVYRIPYHEARGETCLIREIDGTVFSGGQRIRLVIAFGLLLWAFFSGDSLEMRVGLGCIAGLIVIEGYRAHYVNVLKALQEFRLVTQAAFIRASVSVFLGILLTWLFGIFGLFVSILVAHLAVVCHIRSRYEFSPGGNFSLPLFSNLVGSGFPIMLFNLFILLIGSVDRLIVITLLGKQEMGYYAIAVMVFGFLMQIPGSAREVMEPQLMQTVGQCRREEILEKFLFRPLVNTAYYVPFLVGAVYFLLPVAVPVILPGYIPGIEPTRILTIGGYFLAMVYVLRGIIVSSGWQTRVVGFMAAGLLVNVAASLLLLREGFGLAGVAAGSSISYLFLFFCLLFYIRRKSGFGREVWRKNLAATAWPFPFMCAALYLLDRHISGLLFSSPWLDAATSLLLYALAFLLLIHIAGRRYSLLCRIDLGRYGFKWTGRRRR